MSFCVETNTGSSLRQYYCFTPFLNTLTLSSTLLSGQVMSAKMIQDGENEGSNSPISTAKNQRKSKVKTDSVTGQVVVSTERRSSLADIIFRRRESTKFVLVGIDNRIPFMAVYQVYFACCRAYVV